MKFEDAREAVAGVPYIDAEHAKILYDFVLKNRPENCLELGFAHGASACYIAAALDELGKGHLVAVDLESGRDWQKPSIDDLLKKTALSDRVTVIRENLSYTWFLKKKIEEFSNVGGHCAPFFDFCYIDGPKNWTVDGLAFFLVDKLLREGGTILFDDLNWTYDRASQWSIEKLEECGINVGEMAMDEKSVPHVDAIFRLLVMQHANYSEFEIQGSDWAWAKKIRSDQRQLKLTETASLPVRIERRLRNLLRRRRR